MKLPFGIIWIATSALLAASVIVLVWRKRRQEAALDKFSRQITQLTRNAGPSGRVTLDGQPAALGQLGGAVNQLLETVEQRGARMHDREQLFQRLVEAVHEAVVVTRDRVLFANQRFLALLGTTRERVIGMPLSNFVAPEYAALVDQNLRRRLAGEPAAERYEAELVGAQGQVTRVEIS
ncbi:MAG: PAS domain-containing protein, partial [Gammaproteobacteria bacterium]|nr:PAS domain-containing protein [Gammaproteobacteria bacterium]